MRLYSYLSMFHILRFCKSFALTGPRKTTMLASAIEPILSILSLLSAPCPQMKETIEKLAIEVAEELHAGVRFFSVKSPIHDETVWVLRFLDPRHGVFEIVMPINQDGHLEQDFVRTRIRDRIRFARIT